MEALKRQAAARALEEVQGGMRVGLGTGSTAKHSSNCSASGSRAD